MDQLSFALIRRTKELNQLYLDIKLNQSLLEKKESQYKSRFTFHSELHIKLKKMRGLRKLERKKFNVLDDLK